MDRECREIKKKNLVHEFSIGKKDRKSVIVEFQFRATKAETTQEKEPVMIHLL